MPKNALVKSLSTYSNTTLVKVKFLNGEIMVHHITIQIQHLLKLNENVDWDNVEDLRFKYNTC